MADAIEYALMAGRAYQTTRGQINWLPDIQSLGWTEFFHAPDQAASITTTSGFEAISFQKGSEIVISFAGTGTGADWLANLANGIGLTSDQLRQAADYYLKVKAANSGAAISFTGHSLGGGLASLMAVFFGETAVTFDQAPFRNSASISVANDLVSYLSDPARGYTTPELTQALAQTLQGLNNFIGAAANGGIPNEGNVLDISVQGEALTVLSSVPLINRIGTQSVMPQGTTDLTLAIGLHSQALLTAFLQSDQAAPAQHSFRDVTFKLPDVVRMIFDDKLFEHPAARSNTTDENFIERLVRHQNGVVGLVMGETPISADAMLDRFNNDLWKLAQNGGLTMTDWALTGMGVPNNLSKTLIAFAMQKYYEENLPAGATPTELFTDLGTGSNGIRFDMADVSTTFATAIAAGEKLNLNDAKGYKEYFQSYLNQVAPDLGAGAVQFTPAEKQLILSTLPALRDWYVQAGASGMNATDTLNRGAFMLGGNGADMLTGGTGTDLLVDNAGDDVLNGGQGSDTLLGGIGVDTYVLNSGAGQGIDTVFDSDRTGYLRDDTSSPIVLTGGTQYGDNKVFRGADANGANHLYTYVSGDRVSGGDLLVDGAMLIKGYSPTTGNHMGITFADAVVQANPATTLDISGDLTQSDPDPAHQQPDGAAHPWTDALGNLLVTAAAAPGRADTLYDSSGNDHIISGGGDDHIFATRGGDDLIEAGAGRDDVNGGAGSDIIIGGSGGDIMAGGDGNDRMYADSQIDAAAAIAQGNILNSGTGLQGDWLAGGTGDDTLVGSTANDVLMGGAGADLLIAGTGNDDIMGDTDWVATNFNWTVADQPGGTRYFYPVNSNAQPTVGAADVIYAGDGADHVWGELGNDVIFGEGGADKLQGNAGNDTILGGAGADWLYGEGQLTDTAGSDYLDGGADADVIFGGAGDDIIVGGTENDTLYGEAGQDTYLFNRGDGNDTVYDLKSENNILRFGAGINSSDVTLRLGSLMLDLGNGDAVHIKNVEQRSPTQLELDAGIYQPGDVIDVLADFDRNDVFNSSSISGFEFADGTILSTAELLARGFDLDGTDLDDTLTGTNTIDRINGRDGNDILMGGAGIDYLYGDAGSATAQTSGNDYLDGGDNTDYLYGGAGDDILAGGKGDDFIYTGSGNDVILYNTGDGKDTIDRSGALPGEAGVVRFGAGINASQVRLGLGSLKLDLGNGDEVHIANFNQNDVFNSASIGSFEFADGINTIDRMRWRIRAATINRGKAANDEAAHAWRVAA